MALYYVWGKDYKDLRNGKNWKGNSFEKTSFVSILLFKFNFILIFVSEKRYMTIRKTLSGNLMVWHQQST